MGSISEHRCPKCGKYSVCGDVCGVCAGVPASSQALVEHRLLASGAEVCKPCSENSPYDLLVKSWNSWHQVQVKTAYDTKEGVRANVCRPNSTGRKMYRHDQVDYFAIVYGEEVYMIPYREVEGKGRINVLADKYRKWKLS